MTEEPTSRNRFAAAAIPPAVVLAASALIGCVNLWRGLYVDEYTTWSVLALPPDELIANRLGAGHLPGYFLALSGWSRLAGISEVALRLPSLVLALGSLAIFMAMVRDLFDRRLAVLAGAFLAGHQLFLWSAQTARPYAPLLLFTVLGWWALVRWLRGGGAGWLALLLVSGLAAFATQPLHSATAAAQALLLLVILRRGDRARICAALAVIAATAILALPMLRALASEQNNFRGTRFRLPVMRLLDGIGHVYLGDYSFVWRNDLLKHITLGALAAHLWGARAAVAMREGTAERRGLLLVLWAAVPLAALLVMAGSGGKSVLAHERYYVTVLPPIAVALALGTEYWRQRFPRTSLLPPLLMAIYSAGWLAQPGDGPKVLAQRLGEPKAIIGDSFAMRYEFRDRPVSIIGVAGKDADTLPDALASAPDSVWLVIYDNYKHPMDRWLNEPPPGWAGVAREEFRDSRALLLQRTSAPQSSP